MKETLYKGMFGATSAGTGFTISVFASELEVWLRIVALIAGIAVSVVTFWSICKKL